MGLFLGRLLEQQSKADVEDFQFPVEDLPTHVFICGVTGSGKTVLGKAIIEEAGDYDLVVLGCTRERLLFQFARESIPQAVARLCPKPLVMVKAAAGLRSWLKRWV